MIPQKYKRQSVVIPACVLIFLVFYLIVGLCMGPLMLESGLTNENFLPVIFSIGGIILCISLIRDGLKEEGKKEKNEKHMSMKQVIIIADFFLFVLLYSLLGILPASLVFVFLFMLFFDDKIERIPRKLIYSVLITAFIYVLYAVIFGVHF